MQYRLAALAMTTIVVGACNDGPAAGLNGPGSTLTTDVTAVGAQANNASSTSSARWNRRAIALFRARGGGPSRPNTYLSIAQYRAVLEAMDERHGQTRPSLAGAAAGASVVVLKQFYPLDAAALDAALAAQRDEPPLGDEHNKDFAAGEAIGREVAAAVLASAASDRIGATSPGTPPVGAGYWVSSGAPIVRGGLGARPFFLTSGDELRLPPPPAFGSPAYLAALAEVRAFALARTADQVALVAKWVPFSAPLFNGIATDLIDKYHRSELESARILAYGNAAAFDAIIACFDTKFAYWFIRPSQADPTITLATGLPNHPSYPSAHSCETGAFEAVLADGFPSEREALDAIAQEASLSRVIGGLHYRFDGDGGLALGRSTAKLALERKGLE
jgi:membrane-associated phospholipid phosphatase